MLKTFNSWYMLVALCTTSSGPDFYACMHVRSMVDRENANYATLDDMHNMLISCKPNKKTLAQQLLLKHHFNGVGTVGWQDNIFL